MFFVNICKVNVKLWGLGVLAPLPFPPQGRSLVARSFPTSAFWGFPQFLYTGSYRYGKPCSFLVLRQALAKASHQRNTPKRTTYGRFSGLSTPWCAPAPPPLSPPWRGLEAGGFSRGKSLSDGCSQVRRSATLAGVMFSLPLVGAWYAEAGGWARGERRLISKSYYRPKKKITADSQHQPPVSGNKIQ